MVNENVLRKTDVVKKTETAGDGGSDYTTARSWVRDTSASRPVATGWAAPRAESRLRTARRGAGRPERQEVGISSKSMH